MSNRLIINKFQLNSDSNFTALYDTETKQIWYKCSDILQLINPSNSKELTCSTYTKKFKVSDSKMTYISQKGLLLFLLKNINPNCTALLSYISADIVRSFFHRINTVLKQTASNNTTETKLHYSIIEYIKNFPIAEKVIPGLGELQDTTGKRISSWKKGYTGGQPDIMIPLTTRYYNGLAIELKSPKNKSVATEKQINYHHYLSSVCGWKVIVSYDKQFIETTIKNYLHDVQLSCQKCKKYYTTEKRLKNHNILTHLYNNSN